jgi:hypothetical protein
MTVLQENCVSLLDLTDYDQRFFISTTHVFQATMLTFYYESLEFDHNVGPFDPSGRRATWNSVPISSPREGVCWWYVLRKLNRVRLADIIGTVTAHAVLKVNRSDGPTAHISTLNKLTPTVLRGLSWKLIEENGGAPRKIYDRVPEHNVHEAGPGPVNVSCKRCSSLWIR